ncbi:MAG: alcohol dehydrogenase catalytic domain-containing protein [Chloroflexi bacterium]|nr:alcohol dehydrogenase catalytic domain-containing protein [Chloroflexota bacterium]
MRAVIFNGPKQLELCEVPVPQPGPGEVVVRVRFALTCGTDLKGYKRGHRLFAPGMIFGHEFAGEISAVGAVGAGMTKWREGDLVTAANSAPCNECFYCRRGQQQLCEDLDNRFNWGAFADYIRVPAHIVAQNMHAAPANVSLAHAGIIEPLACAIHGVDVGRVRFGDTVAIIGAGAQSLMQIRIARAMGAAQVLVVGRSRGRLERARAMGATHVFSTHDGDALEFVRTHTAGRGADVTLEAAGAAETWQQALAMTRPGGTYGQVVAQGIFHHTPRYVEMALQMLASGALDAGALIDGEIPLEQVEDGLQRMDRSEVVKLAVRVG